jgi:hypothetical protein
MERPQPDRIDTLRHLFYLRAGELAEHTETGEQLDLATDRYEEVEGTDVPGVYEHYKSTQAEPRLYYVGSVAHDREEGAYIAVYMPLYELDEKKVYARPLDLFLGSVEQDGQLVPRFRRL